jgi:hypothetical protein
VITARLEDILTKREIKRAVELCRKYNTAAARNRALVAEIISPNIERITRKLGQACDPSDLGWTLQTLLEYEAFAPVGRPGSYLRR